MQLHRHTSYMRCTTGHMPCAASAVARTLFPAGEESRHQRQHMHWLGNSSVRRVLTCRARTDAKDTLSACISGLCTRDPILPVQPRIGCRFTIGNIP